MGRGFSLYLRSIKEDAGALYSQTAPKYSMCAFCGPRNDEGRFNRFLWEEFLIYKTAKLQVNYSEV